MHIIDLPKKIQIDYSKNFMRYNNKIIRVYTNNEQQKDNSQKQSNLSILNCEKLSEKLLSL